MRIGSGYIGSDSLKTSVSNDEVVPSPPANWKSGYNFYKFSFLNYTDCTVQVNNENTIFLKANQGFSIDALDAPIHSFKVVESGVQYSWVAGY